LPLPDRGLEFGDGLFETLLLEHGEPLYLDLHWQRLERGLQVLGFPHCLPEVDARFRTALDELLARGWSRGLMRITVTRGGGPRGYAPPPEASVRIVVSATELLGAWEDTVSPAALVVAQSRWGSQPQLAGIKHCNRLEQVLAAAEKQRAGADEALMLGQGGQLVSVTAGNLFLRLGNELHTPSLEECGIAGTRRRLLMERWAPAIGVTVRESRLEWSDLESAREVFYSNSRWGLRPVSGLGELRWASQEIYRALYRQYRGDRA
jgi:4-amino-4-deoxychorismate lyase